MPNWVFNKVYFYGESAKLKAIKEFLNSSEDTPFDFNRIIPMPKSLNMTAGSDESIAIACSKARKEGKTTCKEYEQMWVQKNPFDFWADLGDKYLENKRKYGATSWYYWCTDNWGTKWNACDVYWSGDNFVSFTTAWAVPEPIYQKLSEMFPDVQFSVSFANEDLSGENGTIEYDGEHLTTVYENDFEFACDVWGYDVDEMREEYECC